MCRTHRSEQHRLPLAATNQFDILDDFVKATKVSLARARDVDFAFFNDVLFKAKTPEYNGYNKRLNREAGMSQAPNTELWLQDVSSILVCIYIMFLEGLFCIYTIHSLSHIILADV